MCTPGTPVLTGREPAHYGPIQSKYKQQSYFDPITVGLKKVQHNKRRDLCIKDGTLISLLYLDKQRYPISTVIMLDKVGIHIVCDSTHYVIYQRCICLFFNKLFCNVKKKHFLSKTIDSCC